MKEQDQLLLAAIEQKQTAELERLLREGGGNPKAETDAGEPLTNVAARLNNVAALEVLKKYGGDIHAFDKDKNPALLAAAAVGAVEAAEFLMAQGALPNVRNTAGETALHLAAKNGKHKIVELFGRKAKYMIDFRMTDGRTAVMIAAGKDYPETLKALLDAGADAKAVDGRDRMAIDFADAANSDQAREILAEHGAGNPMRDGLGFDFDAPAAATFKPHSLLKAPGA